MIHANNYSYNYNSVTFEQHNHVHNVFTNRHSICNRIYFLLIESDTQTGGGGGGLYFALYKKDIVTYLIGTGPRIYYLFSQLTYAVTN